MNWLRLFISTYGVIGQRTYLHGAIVIVFVNVALALLMLVLKLPPAPALLVTLVPSICVTAKRLRTFRVSAWWQVPQRVVLAAACLATLIPQAWWTANPIPLLAAFAASIAAAGADGAMFAVMATSSRRPSDTVEEVFG
jgi:uncharacterized membrane protein YhaH (DUF805 family)